MMDLSLCMIVKNEELVLARCLECVKDIVNEIIIVDTGSDDKTKEIAAQFTDEIYDFEWCDDFSAARNFAFSKAAGSYIMWLDADDIILREDIRRLRLITFSTDPADVYMLPYVTALDENGKATFSFYRERIVRNCDLAVWHGFIHETITPFGRIAYGDAQILHKKEVVTAPGRNLRIYENAVKKGRVLSPRDKFYYGRELCYAQKYQQSVEVLADFLQGEGWSENKIEACRIISSCYEAAKEETRSLNALLQCFLYGEPKGEVCCDIGSFFMKQQNYVNAAFWYKAALNCVKDVRSGAFIMEDCYGFIPALQLCVCYDKMGDIDTAIMYNTLAGAYKPNNASVAYNVKYFSGLK